MRIFLAPLLLISSSFSRSINLHLQIVPELQRDASVPSWSLLCSAACSVELLSARMAHYWDHTTLSHRPSVSSWAVANLDSANWRRFLPPSLQLYMSFCRQFAKSGFAFSIQSSKLMFLHPLESFLLSPVFLLGKKYLNTRRIDR